MAKYIDPKDLFRSQESQWPALRLVQGKPYPLYASCVDEAEATKKAAALRKQGYYAHVATLRNPKLIPSDKDGLFKKSEAAIYALRRGEYVHLEDGGKYEVRPLVQSHRYKWDSGKLIPR